MGLMNVGGTNVKEMAVYGWIVTYRMYCFFDPKTSTVTTWGQVETYDGEYIRFIVSSLSFYALKPGLYSISHKETAPVIKYCNEGDLIGTANNKKADLWIVCKL